MAHPDDSFITLSDLLKIRARETPARPFLVCGRKIWRYAEFETWVETIARNLVRGGLLPEERVAMFQRRRPDTVAAFLAISRAGALPVPINYRLGRSRLSQLLAHFAPAWVIAHDEFFELLRSFAAVLPPRGRWILGPKAPEETVSWKMLERAAPTTAMPTARPDEACYIDSTSGTWGNPKGVLTTHRGIAANARGAIAALGLRPDDVHLSLFAVFAHAHELLGRTLFLGGSMVLLDSLRPGAIAQAINQHGVTCVMGVPSIYEIAFRPIVSDRRLRTVRIFESGGGVTPEALIERFKKASGTAITPVWGSTETAGIALAGPPECGRPSGALGLPCPGFEARIIDENGETPSVGSQGELLLRSESMMQGYFRLDEGTEAALDGGWYHTGDLFRQDDAGFFYFQGRINDMIKTRGLKVSAMEVEQVLLAHPGVTWAAVVGKPSPRHGELPVAFVVLKSRVTVRPEELKAFCRERLASFKVPQEIHFRESLPQTGSGKILKSRLLD